jgi:hypothetical protein
MGLLVSLADYKTVAQISGTAQDARLTILLGMASAEIRRACGRDLTNGFESATRTETYPGTDESTVQLNEWPVTSITSVTVLTAGGGTEVLDSDSYRVDAATGLLSRIDVERGRFSSYQWKTSTPEGSFKPSPRFEEGFFNVSVVYVGGYATIPLDIQGAVCQITSILSGNVGANMSLKSESLGQYSVTRQDAKIIDEIKAGLVRAYNTGST